MSKQIKILQPVKIYSDHEYEAETSNLLNAGDIVKFNREKRRNGIDWMEIFINNRKVYIKKDMSKLFILKEAKLMDNSCTVVFYKPKNDIKYKFNEAFTVHQFADKDQGSIRMRRIYEVATKEKYIDLYYDKDMIEVSKTVLAKGEKIIITSENRSFLEILYGKKTGYILADVAYYEARNWWVIAVGVIVALGVISGSFYALIDSGRTVVGPILAIPIIIIVAIIVFFIKFFLAIINIIFQNIRKRL
ncbi:hypothetical protein HNP38_000368 [Chryseobacterium defluvii]|uniref:Uncharacterized protein n=1 Tax=Chryseobacterium defluvii TaxID=160396 RepID=A0A840K7A7_9FLAO|nr:hypothetical protein [Chryseobacterium defluvii]MBB4805096.1 hypothetical protein [Chryseobacterium defluvii]